MPFPSKSDDLTQNPSMGPRTTPQNAEQPHEIGLGIHRRKSDWAKSMGIESNQNQSNNEESQRSHAWLLFMIVAIVLSLLFFMLIPILDNFFLKNTPNNALENIKQFISFTSPVVIIITALAGAAGYFLLKRVAWLSIAGLFLGIGLFAITIKSNIFNLNLGIYWILVGALFGGALGSLWEFIHVVRTRYHKELLTLFAIGVIAPTLGLYFLIQENLPKTTSNYSYQGAADQVSFTLFQPTYLPEKLTNLEPKVYVTNDQVNIYYGNDHYPPPPIIDFLTGIEFTESESITGVTLPLDPEPGSVYVDIGTMKGKYSERTGRSTIEWDQENTHIVMNVFSNIPAREVFKIARTVAEVKATPKQ